MIVNNWLNPYQEFREHMVLSGLNYSNDKIFEMFVKRMNINETHSLKIYKFNIKEDSTVVLTESRRNNITIYKFNDKGYLMPTSYIIIYLHTPPAIHFDNIHIIEKVKGIFSAHVNFIYLYDTDEAYTDVVYHNGMGTPDYYRYIIKKVDDFAEKDLMEFNRNDSNCCCRI